LACFEFVGFSQNDFRNQYCFYLPFEYGLISLSTNRLFDMEILRSTDFVDYYFRFGVFGLVHGNVDIVNFISNGKTEQHDLSDGHPKG
jgi:hypothetical protein